MPRANAEHALKDLLRQAKILAVKYADLIGKPLGVIGEVAEYEAAQKLSLTIEVARTAGYDAFCKQARGRETFQIKGRAVVETDRYRGRVPTIDRTKLFDAVLLVLLDKTSFEPLETWRAERGAVKSVFGAPGSKARNERGSMGIAQFRSIPDARRVWP